MKNKIDKSQLIGKEYPVWWDTGDKRPAGQHKARVLDAFPYTGRYDFHIVLRLAAPNTHRGWLEMAVNQTDLKYELT